MLPVTWFSAYIAIALQATFEPKCQTSLLEWLQYMCLHTHAATILPFLVRRYSRVLNNFFARSLGLGGGLVSCS